jgi:NAD(P)-dependent dehydrogenase (short-subunit alcohol dehydrogenase family)
MVDAGAHAIAGSRTRGPKLGELEEAGKVTFVSADLSTPDGADGLVAAAADHGGIDILVNNAGALTVHPEGFASVTDDDWQASWELNVMGVVRTTRAALPAMYKRGGGSIVIVGSVNAYFPDPGIYDYCATKAAITNIGKALSKELGPKNIRVNRSARDRCRPGCSSTTAGSRIRSPVRVVRPRSRSGLQRPVPRRRAGSPHRNRSPTWSCSLPATGRAISAVPT